MVILNRSNGFVNTLYASSSSAAVAAIAKRSGVWVVSDSCFGSTMSLQ